MVRSALIAVGMLGGAARAEPFTPAPLPEPHWLVYAAIHNDAFTELIPPVDDRGFTHDNVFVLRRQSGDYVLGGGLCDRWITSRIDRRRWDQLDVFAIGERIWIEPLAIDLPHQLLASAHIGPSFGGNFGGRYLQNGWHALSKTGPTLDQGLANNYDHATTFGFVLGARARAELGEMWRAYALLDGQLALGGTGVTSGELALGGSVNTKHVGAHVELAVARYHVTDPGLALAGAYGTGWQVEWRAGVHVRWSRFHIGYEYRANEGGSGEPIGVIEFQAIR